MGNTRSTSSAASTPEEIKLQQAYESLISNNEEVAKDLDKYFCTLRILVVGKSGSGKSTLIRLLLREDGPGPTIMHGRPGEQDIHEEWRCRHAHLPVIIHDSDGISTNGQEMMEKIVQFLGDRLANSYVSPDEIPKRVHAVWYVFSALDNRVLDDNGLLKMLDGYGKELPLLLIMTHNDIARSISSGEEEMVLEQVLESISNDEKRERLRQSTVRVGNEIEIESETGQIRRVDVDEDALVKVSERTMQLLAMEVRMTWASCQAVDMMAKVKASISFILKKRSQQAFASLALGAVPAVHPLQMKIMFGSVTKGLSKIWKASENLEKAIISCKYLEGRRGEAVMGNLSRNMMVAFAALLSITMAAGISAAPAVVAAVSASVGIEIPSAVAGTSVGVALKTVIEERRLTSKNLTTYCLHVLCAIMYVRKHDVTGQRSVDDYVELLQEFFNSKWVREIPGFSEEENELISQVAEFFKGLAV